MATAKPGDDVRWKNMTKNMGSDPAERDGWNCSILAFVFACVVFGFAILAAHRVGMPNSLGAMFAIIMFLIGLRIGGSACASRAEERAPKAAVPKVAAKPAVKPVAKKAPVPKAAAKPAVKPVATKVEAPEAPPEAPPVEEAAEEAPIGTRPVALDGPRDGGGDDLTKIKGVGPKLAELCNTLGFYHFDQIAGWSPDEVAWVDEHLEGFKGRVTRDDWVAQAKILAAGGETEFSARQ